MPKRKSRVTYRQIDGDDGYQWCVLIDGHIKWNGMTRNEAEWRAKEERKALGKEGGDMMQYGTRVKILSGGSEFVGKTGRVVGEENYGRQKLYRVRLDEPVIVEGVGRVTHDLWEKQYLRRTT